MFGQHSHVLIEEYGVLHEFNPSYDHIGNYLSDGFVGNYQKIWFCG